MMHIMIDIETLGIEESAAILEIGAVAFNGAGIHNTFRVSISLADNLKRGRTINAETIEWWMEQSDEARSNLFDETDLVSFEEALTKLRLFIVMNLTKHSSVWANGVSFDLAILKHAYDQIRLNCPWRYGDECCMRTLRRINSSLGQFIESWGAFKKRMLAEGQVAHSALCDARVQAEYVMQWLNLHENIVGRKEVGDERN